MISNPLGSFKLIAKLFLPKLQHEKYAVTVESGLSFANLKKKVKHVMYFMS